MRFMIEGGPLMWVIFASAVFTGILSILIGRERRVEVLVGGVALLLMESVFGMAAGMAAVASFAKTEQYAKLQDQAGAIAQGLGELSNNGVLGAVLALLLGLAAVVVRWRQTRGAAEAQISLQG